MANPKTMKTNSLLSQFPAGLAVTLAALLAASASGQISLDGFDPNADGHIRAIAIQADGRILIGDGFTTVGASARAQGQFMKSSMGRGGDGSSPYSHVFQNGSGDEPSPPLHELALDSAAILTKPLVGPWSPVLNPADESHSTCRARHARKI